MRAILICLAGALAACSPTATADRSADEAAVRAAVDRLVESWNAQDSAGFASVFAAQHDYVAVDGQMRLGISPAANAAGHEQVWQAVYPEGSIIRMDVEAIRFPAPDVAILQAANHNDYSQGGQSRTLTSSLTGVLVREDDGWKIVAFNNNAGQGGGGPAARP